MILRPGFITQQMLSGVVGETDMDVTVYDSGSAQAPRAPGMKYRHYAPRGELVIVDGEPNGVVRYINEQAALHEAQGERTGVIGTEGGWRSTALPASKMRGTGTISGRSQGSSTHSCASLMTRRFPIYMRSPLRRLSRTGDLDERL